MTDLALPGSLTPVSLSLRPGLSYEEWAEALRLVGQIGRASPWWVGDAICYGEAQFGERYAQAVDGTRLSPGTLVNLAWVASRIPPSRRREGLSFAHHTEVAPLETAEADEWLRKAEDNGWTRADLRAAMGKKPKALSEADPLEVWARATVEAVTRLRDQETSRHVASALGIAAMREQALASVIRLAMREKAAS